MDKCPEHVPVTVCQRRLISKAIFEHGMYCKHAYSMLQNCQNFGWSFDFVLFSYSTISFVFAGTVRHLTTWWRGWWSARQERIRRSLRWRSSCLPTATLTGADWCRCTHSPVRAQRLLANLITKNNREETNKMENLSARPYAVCAILYGCEKWPFIGD